VRVEIGNCVLYRGDCLELYRELTGQAIVTDPPYGCGNDCDYTRFVGGLSPSRNHHHGIAGDDTPFDPTPWLAFPKVCLFGFNHFADRLPLGTVFVWLKKRDNQIGTFLSDCELGWFNHGRGCYCFRHVWHGFDRASERGKTLHPTQKPAALWRFCIDRMKLQEGQTVIDPYMGSGSVGLACMEAGLNYIGVEIVPEYFDIAVERLKQAS
jgi:site-specific DNA-methyltransferase (adenine-specific)